LTKVEAKEAALLDKYHHRHSVQYHQPRWTPTELDEELLGLGAAVGWTRTRAVLRSWREESIVAGIESCTGQGVHKV
jgi:hypothetical protein